jgi:hypothetical protein
MSTIKKGYTELHALLVANSESTVSEIMAQCLAIMSQEVREEAHRYVDGRLEIFCYYHKQWEFADQVPYGSKQNTKTKLNTMCKIGTNNWTTQYRIYKESADKILKLVAAGKLGYEDIPAEQAKYAEKRHQIVPLEVTHWNEAHADDRQTATEE